MRRKIAVLFIAVLFLCAAASLSAGERQVRVGVYQNSPLVFVDENGIVQGVYADFLREVARLEDWRITWVPGTFSQGLQRLEKGEIDLFTAIAYSDERAEKFDFNRLAITANWGAFYVPRGLSAQSILDMENRVVAVVSKDIYFANLVDLASRFGFYCDCLEVTNYDAALRALEEGRAQAALVSRLFGEVNAKKYNVESTSIVIAPVELRFAMPKGTGAVVSQVIDFCISSMRREPNSVLSRSVQRWISGDQSESGQNLYFWISIVVACAAAVIVMMSFVFRMQIGKRTLELFKSRQDLAREKLFFEQLFEQGLDGIALENPEDNSIIKVNGAFEKIFGYSRDECLGKTLNDLVVPPTLIDEACVLDDLDSRGEALFKETVRMRKNGDHFDASISSVPVVSGDDLLATYTIYRDISKRKQAEREILASREEIGRSLGRMQRIWEQTIDVLSTAAETRDPYTAGHQRRVAALAIAIAREMGLSAQTIQAVSLAARIHDIGKINIPAEILSKPGKLGEVEFGLIKTHPQAGYEIIQGIEMPWPVAEVVRQHHERLDGSGYPRGLQGEEILPESHIVIVADVVEAMSSHRPYREAKGIESALAEIESGTGVRYDPEVAKACLKLFREGGFEFPQV
ncbi:MAG: transporter substrate-binding domain-containing protein [Synergistota bacterium]|nr:transporter substrate-binding domain-containing protein [Synergistota bacterium]